MSLSLTILVGCGGGNNFWGGSSGGNGGQNSPPPSSFAENWHFDVSTSALTIDAALTLSSNSIVGVAHFQSYTAATDCPAFFDDLPLTGTRSEEHTSELQSLRHLVCRLLLEKKQREYRTC